MTPTERDILLGVLLVGSHVPIRIAEVTGRHPKSVSRSAPSLVDLGLVVQERGVISLTPEGYAEARRILREEARKAERDREEN